MGTRQGSVRRAAKVGVFVAGLVLALSMTGTAFAANTAIVLARSPRPGTSSTVTKPLVSITVYDRYGVRGLGNYSMTINGQPKKVRISYFAGYGYKKFKLSYQVQSDMSAGLQKVVVNVKDLRSYRSSFAWNFTVLGGTVLDGTPPVTTSDAALSYAGPATIHLSATDNAGGSGVAHTYYKLDGGAQTEGTAITVSAAGSHALEYWSVDVAGNVEAKHSVLFNVALPTFVHWTPALSCTVAGCHWADLATIHIAKGCAMCHANGVTPRSTCTDAACHGTTMPLHHTAGTHPVIASSGTPSCTQATCHGTAAVAIHTGGCAVCHNSPLAVVKAAVANGNATCETCHTTSYAAIHAAGTASHAVSGTCFNSQCHPSDAAAIHTAWANPPGCAACHGAGRTPSLTCATCHSNIGTVHDFAHANASGTKSTACTACHGTDLPAVHTNVGCVCHTASFLVAEMTPLILAGRAECVDCHTGAHAAHGFDQTAAGHSTSTYGYRGMRTLYDGTPGAGTVLDTRGDPIEGEWAIPTARVFWKPGAPNTPAGAYLGAGGTGLTAQSEITCRDCHTGIPAETGDPHGAQTIANAGIDPNYPVPYKNAVLSYYVAGTATNSNGTTFTLNPAKSGINYRTSWETTATGDLRIGDDEVICAKCHDLFEENAAGTGNAPGSADAFFGFGNFVHEEHSRLNALGRGDCVNCHVAIPHGWNRPRLLIQSYSGVATQTEGGVVTTVAVTADPFPYSAPRGYYVAGRALGGFASFFPGMEDKRMGLALLPAIWSDETTPPAGYVRGGPGDHPAITIPAIGEMTSSFVAPEWQESSSACQAGCGGSLGRHPLTTQGSFIK